ncbi:MAG: S-layer homology domain-containing protein [Oscillospiraceae bacterium]|nr:S-layer homology domain-containing protein [Oscillospiraceae bacterium]
MHRKKLIRFVAISTALSLLLATGVLAAVLGTLINGHETYLGAGMELSKGVYWTGSDYQTENYIEYSTDSSVYPVIVSGSKVCNYGNFSTMASLLEKEGKHVIAGMNGDYYVVANYEPLGIEIQNGELWSSDADHWAIGFLADGSAVFGKPDLSITANISGTDFSLDGVNKTRSDGGAVLYTDDYSSATKNSGDGTDIICSISAPLSANCSATLTVEEIKTTGGAVSIPAGKAILSVSANATEALKTAIASLAVGSTATVNIASPSEWANVTYAIGSLYKLVTNGAVEAGLPTNENAPRTAVGKKADGSLVFYTVDGRKTGYSVGITIAKLAQRMLELGCVEATIMDGGGSTSMNAIYLGDSSASQINSPSDGYQRSVTNYIMLVTDAKPTGTASRLALYPLSTNILSGATSSFALKAADENGYSVAIDRSVALAVSSGLGTISSDGKFTAAASGSGNITATASGLIGASVQLNVVTTPDSITLKKESSSAAVTSLAVSTESTTALTASAMKNHVSLISQDKCYTWSCDGGIGTIAADGTFIAGKQNASGTITVKAGDYSVSIPVTVTNPEKFDDVVKTDWFYGAVKYVGDSGIMTGTANRIFEPNSNMTRAMVVTVLYRIEGSPEPSNMAGFSDVAADQWYAKAVYWASQNGIVQGYNGKFEPDVQISREQLATILYRYSASPETSGTITQFTDASAVQAWAKDALCWASEHKYINGVTETLLSPQENATRAQVAAILYRMAQ